MQMKTGVYFCIMACVLRSVQCISSRLLTSASRPAIVSALVGDIKPRVIFVLGGPGAGKGTQCEKLAKDFGMSHLSAGELLRQERLSGSADGELIESYITAGKIVPVKITLALLRKALETSSCSRFLVDGFPRNADNLEGWESSMNGVCEVETMLFLEVGQEELEKRLLSRGKTSGRSDDNIDAAKKRFATFKEVTMPVVTHFESQNKLVKIRGEGSIDAVYSDMCTAINPLFKNELLKLNNLLLAAVAYKDWSLYSSLCDPDLTYAGPDTDQHVVRGLDQQRLLFSDNPLLAEGKLIYGAPSTMQNTQVKVMGKAAIVSYHRVFNDGAKMEESRVWHLVNGNWRNVHTHSSILR